MGNLVHTEISPCSSLYGIDCMENKKKKTGLVCNFEQTHTVLTGSLSALDCSASTILAETDLWVNILHGHKYNLPFEVYYWDLVIVSSVCIGILFYAQVSPL